MQNATVSAWCEEREREREMLLPTCARESAWNATGERDGETEKTVCRSHNVAFSTHKHTHACTHTRAHARTKKRSSAAVEYRRFGWRDKAKPRADEILRRTHEERLKRNRSPPPSVTGLAPVFSTPLRFRRRECEWYSNGPLVDRDGQRMKCGTHLIIRNELRYIRRAV